MTFQAWPYTTIRNCIKSWSYYQTLALYRITRRFNRARVWHIYAGRPLLPTPRSVQFRTYSETNIFFIIYNCPLVPFAMWNWHREKGRDLTQSYYKSPCNHRKVQNATWQHKNATKNFDYTTIAVRLSTVSWRSNSHPTGVVKSVYGIFTFPLTATAVLSKGHTDIIMSLPWFAANVTL